MHNINPLKTQLNPICHLLALLGAHHILHVSRIRVNIMNIHHAAMTYTEEIHISVNNHTILDPSLGFTMMSTQEKCHNSVAV